MAAGDGPAVNDADVIITVSMGKLSVVMTPFLRLFCARSRLLLVNTSAFTSIRAYLSG